MGSNKMDKAEEQILRAAKEIIVKFIETGRITPTTFSEHFKNIYGTIEELVHKPDMELSSEENSED